MHTHCQHHARTVLATRYTIHKVTLHLKTIHLEYNLCNSAPLHTPRPYKLPLHTYHTFNLHRRSVDADGHEVDALLCEQGDGGARDAGYVPLRHELLLRQAELLWFRRGAFRAIV